MFIIYPTNIDYLIQDVRLHVGDFDGSTKYRFSDSIVRTALIGGVKMLQRRWQSRYLVFDPSIIVNPLPQGYVYYSDYENEMTLNSGVIQNTYTYVIPSGYVWGRISEGYGTIPSGLKENDVFRNVAYVFMDSGTGVISQEDEFPVVLAASIVLRKSVMSSSADSFQSWSDGEFSFSNLGTARALGDLYNNDAKTLDDLFKKRLSGPLKSTFRNR